MTEALTAASVEPRILDMRLAIVPGIVVAVCLACDAVVVAQGLGDVAKREAERRKAVGTPGKVYTNDNLRTEAPPTSAPATTPQGDHRSRGTCCTDISGCTRRSGAWLSSSRNG